MLERLVIFYVTSRTRAWDYSREDVECARFSVYEHKNIRKFSVIFSRSWTFLILPSSDRFTLHSPVYVPNKQNIRKKFPYVYIQYTSSLLLYSDTLLCEQLLVLAGFFLQFLIFLKNTCAQTSVFMFCMFVHNYFF